MGGACSRAGSLFGYSIASLHFHTCSFVTSLREALLSSKPSPIRINCTYIITDRRDEGFVVNLP